MFPPRTRLHNQTPAKGEPGSEGDDDGDGNDDDDDGDCDGDNDDSDERKSEQHSLTRTLVS